jgi:hydrogenase expression/formation protein HypC
MCLAIPALVTELLPGQMARISLDGVMKTISVMLVEDVAPGDYVIVHVGHALARLDPDEAERTLALLAEMAAAGVRMGEEQRA